MVGLYYTRRRNSDCRGPHTTLWCATRQPRPRWAPSPSKGRAPRSAQLSASMACLTDASCRRSRRRSRSSRRRRGLAAALRIVCASSTACVVDAVVTMGRSARRGGALQARAAWDRRQDLRAPAEQAPGAYNCCRTPPTPSGERTRLAYAAVRGRASGPPTSNDRPSRSKRIAAVVAPA